MICSVAIFLSLGHLAVGAAVPYSDLRALLQNSSVQWSPQTELFFPNTTGFKDATQRWSSFEEPTYKAAVRPGTELDVRTAVSVSHASKNDRAKPTKVSIATLNSIPFLATGGKHGYSTSFGELGDGLAIDLSNFNTINVDKNASTVTIGGGVRFSDIFDPLYAAGKELRKLFVLPH